MQGGIETVASVCYSLMVSLLQDGVEGEEEEADTQVDGREEEVAEEDGMVGEVDTEGKEEAMVMAAMVLLEDTISSKDSNNITTHRYNCTISCY